MNRSRKSFLDDLLDDDPNSSSPMTKARPSTAAPVSMAAPSATSRPKSVRFSETGHDQGLSSFGQSQRSLSSVTFDQLFSNDGHGSGDDNDILGSMSFTRGSRSNVSNVQPSAGSPLNVSMVGNGTNPSGTTNSRPLTGKADWLGLSDDADAMADAAKKPAAQNSPPSWLTGTTDGDTRSMAKTGTSGQSSEVDTFTSGGSSSRTLADEGTRNLADVSSIDFLVPGSVDKEKNKISVPRTSTTSVGLQEVKGEGNVLGSRTFSTNPSTDSSLLLLQTQVKVLEMEKENLKQSLEKCKNNHNEEITMMKNIHEKQLEMTRNIIAQQESLVGDDSNRRISDLKQRLELVEKEREEERLKWKQRMDQLYQEWKDEVTLIQSGHRSQVSRLTADHEEDIERIKKRKELELDTMVKLNGKSESLSSLLGKWNQAADQMEQLQSKVVKEQEQLINDKMVNFSEKVIKLDGLDNNWNNLRTELMEEKERMKCVQGQFLDTMKDQRVLLQSELKALNDERAIIDEERRLIEKEKKRINEGIISNNEFIANEKNKILTENEMLMKERQEINTKLIEIKTKEEEQRMKMSEQLKQLTEKESLIKDNENRILIESNTLMNEKKMIDLEKNQLKQMKEIMDQEKLKLNNLANQVKERARELECLSEHASREKEETIAIKDNLITIKKQLDKQSKELNERNKLIHEKESRLNMELSRINHEWNELKNMKDTILCSLCNMSINKGYAHIAGSAGSLDTTTLSSLYHSWPQMLELPGENGFRLRSDDGIKFPFHGHFHDPVTSIGDPLSLWQIQSQQDTVQLAEETAFVQRLKRAAIREKEEEQYNE